jgi:hypothetical protein
MILKINPADVVSIPADYNGAKGRCCKYTVVAQVNGDPAAAFASVVNGDYPEAPVTAGEVADEDTGDQEAFDVVRVYGGAVEAYGVSYQEASDLVAKHVRQKKAQLKIVSLKG